MKIINQLEKIYKTLEIDHEGWLLNIEENSSVPDELDIILEKDFNMKYLGNGCCRRVYYDKSTNTVFKFGSKHSNRTEWNFYQSLLKRLKGLFAQPLEISRGSLVLQMEYIDTIIEDLFPLNSPKADKHGAVIKITDLVKKSKLDKIVHDIHPGNIGVNKDKEIKIIDYGFIGRDIMPSVKRIKKNLRKLRIPKGYKGPILYEKILPTTR